MFRISLLIITVLLSACTKTVVTEYGKIEPDLRIQIEDFVGLTEEEIKAKYLNKKVTILKADTGICGRLTSVRNVCLRQYGLADLANDQEPSLEMYEYPLQVHIMAYFNYSKRSHAYLVNNADGLQIMPTDEQLSHRINIDENVTQNPCFHPEYAPMSNIHPSNPDKPWEGCEFTYPNQITGLVFGATLYTPKKSHQNPIVTLSIIPTGFNYTLEKPRL